MNATTCRVAVGCLLAGFCIMASNARAQIIGTQNDLLDDTTTFSSENLQVRRYVTLPNSTLGQQETKFIISMTTQPGDNDAFYTSSQDGRIHRITDIGLGQGVATEWFNVNDSIAVERGNTFHGGLRSIAFHPEFANDTTDGYGKLYASLIAQNGDSGANFIGNSGGSFQSVVAEWTYDFVNDQVDTSSYRELFRVKNPQLDHPIKQLTFNPLATTQDDDYGLLYIAQGDGSILATSSGTGQNTDEALGKILRVDPIQQGALPYTTPGNVFALDNDANTMAEIYSYGHRNPHHLAFGESGGENHLITAEVGQDLIDEINLPVNGGNFGWSLREGTFEKIPDNQNGRGYGIRPVGDTGTQTGDSGRLLPTDDDGLELIYPALQLDHNDPTDGNRYGVAGGPVIDGRYYYSIFAGNSVRPGGQIYSVPLADLVSQKTTFDAGAGEDVTDLTWINDHVQHRIEFDDDNNPATAPILYDDFAQLLGLDRSDIRFGVSPAGDMLFSSKRTGEVYLVTNNFTPEVGVLLTVDLASGAASVSNQSDSSIEIDGYALMSSEGDLDPNNWNTWESQAIDDGDWVASPGLATVLTELQQFGSTTLDGNVFYNLGNVYSDGAQNLKFQYLVDGQSNPLNASVEYVLAGDYNDDGEVNIADYTVWRDNLGGDSILPNDMTPGLTDASDYSVWKQNFGASIPGAAALGSGSHSVPEPSAVFGMVSLVGAAALCLKRRTLLILALMQASTWRSRMPSRSICFASAILACVLSTLASPLFGQAIQLAFGDRVGAYTNGTDGVVDAGPLWNSTGAGVGEVTAIADFGTILDSQGAATSINVQMGLDAGGFGNADYSLNPRQSGSSSGGGVFANGLWENWAFSTDDNNLFIRINGLLPGSYDIYALTREHPELGRTYNAYAGIDSGGLDSDDDIADLSLLGVGTTANDNSSLDELEDYFTGSFDVSIGDSLVVAVDPTNEKFATLQGLQLIPGELESPCDDYDGCFALVSQNMFTSTDQGAFAGDFNVDGVVNFADFRQIKSQFLAGAGALAAGEGVTNVPEPTAVTLALASYALAVLRLISTRASARS